MVVVASSISHLVVAIPVSHMVVATIPVSHMVVATIPVSHMGVATTSINHMVVAIRQTVVVVKMLVCRLVVAGATAVVHGALMVTRTLELATSMVVEQSTSMVVEQSISMVVDQVVTVVTAMQDVVVVAEELEGLLCAFAVVRMATSQLGAQMLPPKLQSLKRMTGMW